MSLLSENVIPGEYGKVFSTDAKDHKDLESISRAIMQVKGVKDVILDEEKFPRELTIHTTEIVEVTAVEDAVKKTGFHAIPKHHFPL